MGWQSYVLPYRGDEGKRRILEVIKAHNEADWEKVEVGETLYQVTDAPMNGGTGPYSGCILCGHGGGRTWTFEWFRNHSVLAFGYGREEGFELPSNKEWFDINRGWEKVFDEEKSLKESASALRGVSTAFGRAAEGKDSEVSSVYEVFGPWATLRAQALEDNAKKIVDIMMQGTPAKVEDDSD